MGARLEAAAAWRSGGATEQRLQLAPPLRRACLECVSARGPLAARRKEFKNASEAPAQKLPVPLGAWAGQFSKKHRQEFVTIDSQIVPVEPARDWGALVRVGAIQSASWAAEAKLAIRRSPSGCHSSCARQLAAVAFHRQRPLSVSPAGQLARSLALPIRRPGQRQDRRTKNQTASLLTCKLAVQLPAGQARCLFSVFVDSLRPRLGGRKRKHRRARGLIASCSAGAVCSSPNHLLRFPLA